MRLTKRRTAALPELNMTPMIDVVFQLLIFFMLVPHISQVNKEKVELPKLQGSEDQQSSTVTINIGRGGDLHVSGRRASIAGVVSVVSREIQQRKGDASRLKLLVRADERGSSRMVNEVVAALAKLGVHNVDLGVEVPQ